MKKLLLLCLVLSLLSINVLAIESSDGGTVGLAQYFDADTQIYFAIRTDDGQINSLDSLIARFVNVLPEGVVPPDSTIRAQLNQATADFYGTNFDETIRPWLGDYAAIGMGFDENMEPRGDFLFFVIESHDRASAEAFSARTFELNEQTPEQSSQGGFTLYSGGMTNDDTQVAVGDDVVFLAPGSAILPLSGNANSLLDLAEFGETLSLLPEDNYNLLMYLNLGDVFTEGMTQADMEALAPLFGSGGDIGEFLGQQAIGFTILDDTTLITDIAINYGDYSDSPYMNAAVEAYTPLDYSILNHLPSNTGLLILGKDISAQYEASIEQLMILDETGELDAGLREISLGLQMMTGLALETDIIDAFSDEYAIYSDVDLQGIMSLLQGGMPSGDLPIEIGFVAETGDAAQAENLVSGIRQLFAIVAGEDPSFLVSEEQIGSGMAQVLSVNIPPFSLDIVAGATDNVFVVGSRPSATAVLTGDGVGLASNPTFMRAQSMIPDNTYTLLYTDDDIASVFIGAMVLLGPAVNDVFEGILDELEPQASNKSEADAVLVSNSNQDEDELIQALFDVLALFDYSVVASSITDSGDAIIRASISLVK